MSKPKLTFADLASQAHDMGLTAPQYVPKGAYYRVYLGQSGVNAPRIVKETVA